MSVKDSIVVWQGKTKDIEFSYADFKGNKTRRKVQVHKVLFDKEKQQFYINGTCQERNAERDFKEDNISTLIQVGSKRYDFEEWMSTLDIEISDLLESSEQNAPDISIPTQSAPSSVSLDDPEVQELLRKVKNTSESNKLKSPWETQQPTKHKSPELDSRKVTPILWIGIFIMPYIFSWFTLRKGHSTSSKFISFGWLLLTLFIGLSNPSNKQSETPHEAATTKQEAEVQKPTAPDCKDSLRCWGDKYMSYAGVYCQSPIESMSKYTFKWTDGMLEPRFSHFRWKDQSQGTVTYIGDKLQLQNGFGAWSDYIYECDFDPSKNLVLDVRAEQGRL